MKVFALFGRPEVLRRFHGWACWFWIVMIPPSALWWKESITYVVALSVYAALMGHWSSWQAARVEVKQDDEIENASDKN